MAGKSTRPTLQDIADKAGCSRSAVSLALRNHPSIPVATRERIYALAKEIGYRPNPLVATLMSQLRGKRGEAKETIAVIVSLEDLLPQMEDPVSFYGLLYNGILRKAESLGFRVDVFCLEKDKYTPERLNKVLFSRGIHGVLLFPGGVARWKGMQLNWPSFATVLIGFNRFYTGFNQVVADYAHDIELALQVLKKSNLTRVGFAVTMSRDRGAHYNMLARFLLFQQGQRAGERVPLIESADEDFTKEEFLRWYERYRPETILTAGPAPYIWLQEAGYSLPEDVSMINLTVRGEEGLAGIDPQTGMVGEAAVELLVTLLQGNQFGIPEFPRMIAIKGKWSPDRSFPELPATR